MRSLEASYLEGEGYLNALQIHKLKPPGAQILDMELHDLVFSLVSVSFVLVQPFLAISSLYFGIGTFTLFHCILEL